MYCDCQRGFLGVGGKTAMDVARDQETRDMILNRGSMSLTHKLSILIELLIVGVCFTIRNDSNKEASHRC